MKLYTTTKELANKLKFELELHYGYKIVIDERGPVSDLVCSEPVKLDKMTAFCNGFLAAAKY